MTRRRALAALLRAHRPGDEGEAAHLRAMHALLEGSGDPFSRTHFVPGHFTASAFVISPDRRSMLLIHHAKLHRWLQPGGHVEPGDADLEAAARREVDEEVGIADLTPARHIFDLDVHAIPPHGDDPGHAHYDVRFLYVAPLLDIRAGAEVRDARWVALDRIEALESDASVMRAVGKLR